MSKYFFQLCVIWQIHFCPQTIANKKTCYFCSILCIKPETSDDMLIFYPDVVPSHKGPGILTDAWISVQECWRCTCPKLCLWGGPLDILCNLVLSPAFGPDSLCFWWNRKELWRVWSTRHWEVAELRLLSLEKRWPRRKLPTLYNYLKDVTR